MCTASPGRKQLRNTASKLHSIQGMIEEDSLAGYGIWLVAI